MNQQCKELQSRLAESINEREKAENRLAKVEQEYNKLKMEVCELQAELRTAISSNSSLHGQVSILYTLYMYKNVYTFIIMNSDSGARTQPA